MSWFSSMFRAPSFQGVNTQRFYDMAEKYRDPSSQLNQNMFGQMSRQGETALGMYGQQTQRMGAQGLNPFANQQLGAERRRISDQVLGGFNQFMGGQMQNAMGYDQLGVQGEQFNAQMQSMMDQYARQNRAGALGMGLGAVTGLSGGLPGLISGLFGGGGGEGGVNSNFFGSTQESSPAMNPSWWNWGG